jgi:hypothetical protein
MQFKCSTEINAPIYKVVALFDHKQIELTETILVKNLPAMSSALYEHKHMVNTMTNRFYSPGQDRTIYEAEMHYTRFIGFIPKLMALLIPGLFKKQVQDTLDRFKSFVEQSPG